MNLELHNMTKQPCTRGGCHVELVSTALFILKNPTLSNSLIAFHILSAANKQGSVLLEKGLKIVLLHQ
jgi:hypothetical protein